MVHRGGVTTKTVIDGDGDMQPPPMERSTRQSTARGSSVRDTIGNKTSKDSSARGEKRRRGFAIKIRGQWTPVDFSNVSKTRIPNEHLRLSVIGVENIDRIPFQLTAIM